MMYWPNGQKILSAANIIMKRPELYAVFLGNFRCGPDSFILHYLRDEMKEKPYLHLEVDEHSADAGMITRCEAYLDSLKGYEQLDAKLKKRERVESAPNNDLEGRTLYFPYGNDVVHLLAAATRSCGFNAEVLPPVSEGDLEIARKHTTGNECFPAICTTGSFVAKLQEPGVDPAKCSFFMPDHNGPCRFGDYNKLHRIIFDKLGFHKANLATPSNDNGYADLAGDQALKWRIRAWKSAYAFDMLKKFQQERRPYELIRGQTDKIYDRYMKELINIVEKGTKEIPGLLGRAGREFSEIPMSNGERKPIIAVVGEIFMRDNPTCSSHMVERVEALGGETLMQLFCEWIEYSTYRFERDSRWKSNYKGIFKAKVQEAFQNYTGSKIFNASKGGLTIDTHFDVHNVLDRCSPYIHKDYDGEPAVALGSASLLTERKISGVIYILPFTCMPGTIIASVTNDFRKDHNGIPWMNFAYEGTDEAGIDTRFQAFMHQAKEYCKENGYSNPAEFTAPA
jgi:predicted nucleotide-binding protein (sugar kinase/HSP70/actin superfamily)